MENKEEKFYEIMDIIAVGIILFSIFSVVYLLIFSDRHPLQEREEEQCRYKKQRESEVAIYWSAEWEIERCRQYGIELKPARQSVMPEEPSYVLWENEDLEYENKESRREAELYFRTSEIEELTMEEVCEELGRVIKIKK